VNLQSFESLLIGGIEFDSPSLGKEPQPVNSYHKFQLVDSIQHLGAQEYAHKLFYIVNFDQSIRGLNVNAPVEYRGLKIGRVVNISSRYNKTRSEILLPVLLEIEPERLGIMIGDDSGVESAHEEIIDLGLFAKLENANLITGQLYVSLDSYDDEVRTVLTDFEGFKQLPTVSTDLNRIAANLGSVLEKVNELKIEPLIENLNATLLAVQDTLKNAGTFIDNSDSAVSKVVESLAETLEQSQKLLKTGEQMFDRGHAVMQSLEEGSTTRYKLDQTLKELQSAARSLNTLLETIEKNPNSLIFGKQNRN
jgi:paraquat-inducible protein B